MSRQMILNAFLMGVGHHEAAWRLPESRPLDNREVAHYQGLAVLAERGLMDSVFFADSPSLMSSVARRPAETLEPTLLLAAMAAVTERVGLVATASTTYEEPYNLARRFATLDTISGGRAGWNVVTTAAADAAANFGHETQPSHAARYERAEEFLEVVQALWDSWDDDAVLADKARGVYADPERVRPIGHRGTHFSVQGALTVPGARKGGRSSCRPGRPGRASRWRRPTPRRCSRPSRRSRTPRGSTARSRTRRPRRAGTRACSRSCPDWCRSSAAPRTRRAASSATSTT